MKSRIVIALSFITILAVPLAYGQSASPEIMGRVEIPFKFMVAKKEMPAGKYEVLKVEGRDVHLMLRNLQANTSIYVSVIERLAETNPSQKHGARVVFDTVGDQKFLSEFWPADKGDGYLLGINKGEQKHEIVEEK
jgi:hypothetical protein